VAGLRSFIAEVPMNPLRQLRVMGRLVRRVTKTPGSAPGTLVHTGPKHMEEVRFHVIRYGVESLAEASPENVDECLALLDSDAVTWVNVDGLHDTDVVEKIGRRMGWHRLLLEDIVSVGQRAKVEEYEDCVYVVMPMLRWDATVAQVREEQVSIVLGPGYVFTFQERQGDVFERVRERARTGRGLIRKSGADYLTYALLDAVVDHYFSALEGVGHLTEELEEAVLDAPDQGIMHRLHELKRELIALRRAIWPVRDLLGMLQRSDVPIFGAPTKVFLRDVHDHSVQVMDTVEALRDVVSGMVDLYLSNVSFRTNEVMKVLTIMATVFIPLTFLVGVYGMNFRHMPELEWAWAYPALWAVMLALAAGMVFAFRKKGWF